MNVMVMSCPICSYVRFYKMPVKEPYGVPPNHCGHPMEPEGLAIIAMKGASPTQANKP